MTMEAQRYDLEWKEIMKNQASSFAQVYGQMESAYGNELTKPQ